MDIKNVVNQLNNGIPERVLNNMPLLLDEGTLGLYELLLPENKLSFFGRSFISATFGDDVQLLSFEWEDYANERCHPDDRELILERTHSLFNNPCSYNSKYRVKNIATGNWHWLYAFGSVTGRKENGVTVISGGVLDITEKMVLQETEQRATTMLDAAPMPFLLFDKQKNILTCNKAAVDTAEMSSKEDLLANYYKLMPEYQPDGVKSFDRLDQLRDEAFRKGKSQAKFYYKLLRGEYVPLRINLSCVEWENEQYVVSFAEDLRGIEAANEETRELEERTLLMLNEMPLACFFIDESYEIIDSNKEAIHMFGADNREELKQLFTKFFPETQSCGGNSIELARERIDNCTRLGQIEFNWDHRHKSGRIIPSEVNMRRVDWGGSSRVVTYVRDLTSVIKANKEARLAEQRSRLMLDATPFACILIDENLKTIDCNATAVSLFKYGSKQELIHNYNKIIPDILPTGESGEEFVAKMRSRALKEGTVHYSFHFLLPEGELMPGDVSIERVEVDGKYLLVGYIQDKREVAAINVKLKEAEALSQTMLREVPLTSFIFDEQGNALDCNDAAVELYGAESKEELISNLFTKYSPQFQPDGTRSSDGARVIKQNSHKPYYNYEWTQRHASGELIPIEIVLKRVKWSGGGYRIGGYGHDLREIKRSMAEIKRTHQELVEARDLAEASMRSKSAFLANMSHEIRTPMTAIIGMSSIAKKSDDMEKVKYCLDKIEDASEHLLGIINDVLDISKIEAGRFLLSNTDFVLEKALARISDVMAFRIDQKRQNFLIKIEPNVPHAIVSDQQRLSQIIMNLLSNANKFTDEGGSIMLTISLVGDHAPAGANFKLRFEVEDNGIGIEPEQTERLFQSFEQGDNSISRRFGGTGLGLTISKSIVEQMGGEIWVESVPGSGSKFVFTVSVKRGIASAITRLNPDIDLSKLHLLIVDDADIVLEYFTNIVKSVGISCAVARSAAEAMESLGEKHANIIFIDWLMPEVNGIELTRRIRRKYGDNVIVIMISGTDWAQIEEEANSAGVDRFIAKPLLPSPVIDCINECVGMAPFIEGAEAAGRTDSYIFEGKHILLAEDIEINSEIVTAMLEETGVKLDYAVDGKEACARYAENPERYDLILMDIHMPEVDGYEAATRIRSMPHPRAATVPIVAMTANVFREDVERCLATGMNGHIAKPVDQALLLSTLAKYL